MVCPIRVQPVLVLAALMGRHVASAAPLGAADVQSRPIGQDGRGTEAMGTQNVLGCCAATVRAGAPGSVPDHSAPDHSVPGHEAADDRPSAAQTAGSPGEESDLRTRKQFGVSQDQAGAAVARLLSA